MTRPKQTPVTVLTGFLGSGKSTLLTRILRDPRFSDSAVVVNEFGEIGLDGFLVEAAPEQLVEMTSGCLCCTIRGDIRQTLISLDRRRNEGTAPDFQRLIVETTGLADPAPVLHTLTADRALARRYRLAGVVTVVDAIHGKATLDRHQEAVKQVVVADRVVVSKGDLATSAEARGEFDRLIADLGRLNPTATVIDRHDRGFDLRRLFDMDLYDLAKKPAEVGAWLNEEAVAAVEAAAHGHDHHHHHGHGQDDHHHPHEHHHDVNRHGADIEAFVLTFDKPLLFSQFKLVLELLVAYQGDKLLRVKGLLNLVEEPDKPLVMHAVQHILHDPVWLERWPDDDDRRSRMVFITKGIKRETIVDYFKSWTKAA